MPVLTITVDITSDIACPWCYVARTRLEQAMEKVKSSFGDTVAFDIKWRAYMIDVRTAPGGEEYLAYNRRRWGGDGWTYELREQGSYTGAAFAKWVWWPNTLRGHALAHWVREHCGRAAEDKLVCELMAATYERGGNVSTVEGLCEVVKGLEGKIPGASVEDMCDAVRKELFLAETQREDREQKSRGVDGVPDFIISSDNLPSITPARLHGCQSPNAFIRAFNKFLSAA